MTARSALAGLCVLAVPCSALVAQTGSGVTVRLDYTPRTPGRNGVLTILVDSVSEHPSVNVSFRIVDYYLRERHAGQRTISLEEGGTYREALEIGDDPGRYIKGHFTVRIGEAEPHETWAQVFTPNHCGGRQSYSLDGRWWRRNIRGRDLTFPPPEGGWVEVAIPEDVNSQGFDDEHHCAWFRRAFAAPDRETVGDSRAHLSFTAVMSEAEVYLNGRRVGMHHDGYMPFDIDVTGDLEYGGENTLLVGVTDRIAITKDRSTARSMALLGPVGFHANSSFHGGIWGSVALETRPPVAITDLLIRTSIRRREIRLQGTIANRTRNDVVVTLANLVNDGPHGCLSLPDVTLSIPAGGEKGFDIGKKWDSPRLWWPHDPHLYVLTSHVREEGAVRDTVKTRFGFREFTVDGMHFRLNGRVFRTRRQSIIYNNRRGGSYERAWRYMNGIKKQDSNMVRFHVAPTPEFVADVCDEVGLVTMPESAFWSRAVWYAVKDERLWANLRYHLRKLTSIYKNHASTVMYSIENEIMSTSFAFHKNRNIDAVEYQRITEDNIYKLCQLVRELDPDKVLCCDSDLDLSGRLETLNIHYPRPAGRYIAYPNDAFWLTKEREGSAIGFFEGEGSRNFFWKRDKPLVVGEYLHRGKLLPPIGGSIFVGERTYEKGGYDEGWLRGLQFITDGLRYEGAGVEPWYFGRGRGKLFPPVYIYVKEFDHAFYSGETVERGVVLYNDTLLDRTFRYVWRVRDADNGTLKEGEESIPLTAGARAERTIAFSANGSDDRRCEVALEISLLEDDKTVYATEREISIFPETRFEEVNNRKVAIYDPRGETREALDRLPLAVSVLNDLSGTSVSGYETILIGRDALCGDQEKPGAVLRGFAEEGGKVIILNQDTDLDCLPEKMVLDRAHAHTTMNFIRAPFHPVLQECREDDFQFWRGDNYVTTSSYRKPCRPGSLTLIDRGGIPYGLDYASLVEQRCGLGVFIVSRLLLTDKLGREPAADRLFKKLLTYTPRPALNDEQVAVWSNDNPAFSELLGNLGVPCTSIGSPDQIRYPDLQTVLLDAEKPISGKPVQERLAEFLRAGGRLLVNNVTPSSLDTINSIVGQDLRLTRSDDDRCVKTTADCPILDGISNGELNWIRMTEKEKGWPERQPIKSVDYSIDVAGGPSVRTLTRPAAIVEIKVGEGKCLVSQLTCTGKYASVHTHVSRYLSLLIRNLAEQGPVQE